jgi:aminoglycoside phosphotransferase (APT) family kinase protein
VPAARAQSLPPARSAPARTVQSSMCDDASGVAIWLQSRGEPVKGQVTIRRVGFGQSNLTTIVTDEAGQEWVLREPPPGSRAQSTHDVEREARIMVGLRDTAVPVPRVVGVGQASWGAPFFVMERVPGAPLEHEDDAAVLDPDQRRELGLQVIRTLARLHTIDPAEVGLAQLGPSTPYLPRQIRRVTGAWERMGVGSAHDSAWQRVRAGLLAALPEPTNVAVIMHGDYRLSNLLVAGSDVTAVLDWELSTLGDPLADLAWLLDDWRSPEEPAISMPSPTRAGGFPSRAEMIDTYRAETGFAVDHIDYYRGFSQWRAASLLQGVLVRRKSGVLGTHGGLDLRILDTTIAGLLDSAAAELSTAC